MQKAPLFLKKYFWDIDFKKLDPEKSPYYVIQRILDFGDHRAIKWLFRTFDQKMIKKTIRKYRGLSKRASIFWGNYFQIPKEKIMYFKKGFPNPPVRIWPY